MNKILGFSWAGLFALCAWLGTVTPTNAVATVALSLIAVLFFVPGALLLYNGITEKKRSIVLAVRYISLASLVLTTLSFVLTVVLILVPRAFVLSYYVLILVSSPLFCGRYIWWLILFLWACLLCASFSKKVSNPRK